MCHLSQKLTSVSASVFDTHSLPELPTFVLPEIPLNEVQGQ